MSEIDPLLLEVLWNRLHSIVMEQSEALIRSSFTPILRDTEDLACGVFDERGDMIVQAPRGTPGHINSMATGVKHFLARVPAQTLQDGDILISNDPWKISGHKHDITICRPIFVDGKLVGFNASTCHVMDIGGMVLSPEAGEVYEEGLHIPIMKLYKAGEPNEELFDLIGSNIRVPDLVIGDIRAQVAGSELSAAQLVDFMREYRLSSLLPISREIFDRSEAAVRRAIAAVPDGTYTNETMIDGFDEPIQLCVAVTIDGETLTVDYTGTSPESPKGINVVYNYTHAYTTYAVCTALYPEVPNNEGSFRPVKVIAPEGSILNAQYPAPVAARHMVGHYTPFAVWGALAQVMPERVNAESAIVTLQQFAGIDRKGRRFVSNFFANGGMGARSSKDGLSAMACPTNTSNTPVEVLESISPLFIRKRELIPDSGGPGKWRGGLGQEMEVQVRSDHPTVMPCLYERVRFPAQGYMGGLPGARLEATIDGVAPHPKKRTVLPPEGTLRLKLAGGGGFYPPEERDPELVLEDVINGLVSLESAERDFKVAISGRSIDWQRTAALRRRA
jgi:N-methylhydantoinase B